MELPEYLDGETLKPAKTDEVLLPDYLEIIHPRQRHPSVSAAGILSVIRPQTTDRLRDGIVYHFTAWCFCYRDVTDA